MSLLAWRDVPYDVEADVRKILERTGEADTSTAACKHWVRRLIRVYVPTWEPGDGLGRVDAERIGEAFERLCASAQPELPEKVRAARRSA